MHKIPPGFCYSPVVKMMLVHLKIMMLCVCTTNPFCLGLSKAVVMCAVKPLIMMKQGN